MARGPFQGSFQPNLRPTVVTAPDALVYLNGDIQVAGCPDCNRVFDFNKYITSIQVDLNVDSVPGSASISLAVPRHTIDDFYFDGNPVITPMMEIEIYAKGYYLLEGIPQYYPIFWGLVTEVNDNYSGGAHTVSINCADILKWWELCKMNVNPALTTAPGKGLSLFGNTMSGMNPYDIIFSLAQQSFGDVVVGTGSLIATHKEQAQKSTFDVALSDLMLYWQSRFSKIRNGLLLYGTNGVAVRGDTLYSAYAQVASAGGVPPQNYVANAIRNANGGSDQGQMVFDPTAPGVVAFRNNYSNIGVNLWQSEFQTKLELAQAAKESIGFEFFMDVDGSVVFKPPFYNLDVLSNKPVSWIQDIDIIDWDFSESEAEVVTQVQMQGSFAGAIDLGVSTELTPYTSVTDYHLLRKYGWRTQTYNSEFLSDPQLMFYQGLDLLDRLNSRRHRGTVNIPMRPELRLGFPIYVAPKDQVWYVTGISHNIAFGSRATTTVTLTAKRTKFIGIKGITTLKLDGTSAGTAPATANTATGTTASGPGNTNSAGSPIPSTAFPYSSRQLSAQASFTLDLGTHPAFLPAVNSDTSASFAGGINPYDPVILRHPTTGRILGYPNVVMIYARPFADAVTNLDNADSNQGRNNPGGSPAIQKNQKQKVTNTQNTNYALDQAQLLNQAASRIREKHIVNRYTYGLTSAGRFVYACDTGTNQSGSSNGVIGEILTLPSKNVHVTPPSSDPSDKLFAGTTCLIRPVSDERGFEVIGHFKYGRRVSLRDGSLVLTGNTNSAVNIDMQLGLGGNLYDTLTAQSHGLTAIQSAYPNPAAAIASMQPSDLETAGVVQPDSSLAPPQQDGTQFVGPSGYNALGGPQQVGTPPSVEAAQLSKALTLAEMQVQEQGLDPGDPNDSSCPCMLSRADLAFLNVGYTVSGSQITSTATSDFTTLGNSVPGAPITATLGSASNPSPLQQSLNAQIQEVSTLQAQLDAVQARADTINQITNPIGWIAAQQTLNQLRLQIDQAMSVQTTIEQEIQINMSAPSQAGSDGTMPSPAVNTVLAKAEQFLTNLYEVLDGPHQELEQTLRGNLAPGGAATQPANYFSTGTTSAPSLAPPFSPSTAAALGNPAAAAIAGDSAINNLTQTWSQFGSQLQSTAQRTMLLEQISNNTTLVRSLQGQIATIQQEVSNKGSSVLVAGGQTAAQAIESLQKQVSMVEQQIANERGQLAQLPAPITGSGTAVLTHVGG
jgi:hypothetical protein